MVGNVSWGGDTLVEGVEHVEGFFWGGIKVSIVEIDATIQPVFV